MDVLSGQITVTTAGTAVAGPTTPAGELFAVKAHPGNTGSVWVGNDGAGDVTNANGFPLDPGEGLAINTGFKALNSVYFDADTNGDKVCWLLLE